MTRLQWESLGLTPREYLAYDAGLYRTVEAVEQRIVGLPKRGKGSGHVVLGELGEPEEAQAVVFLLRFMTG